MDINRSGPVLEPVNNNYKFKISRRGRKLNYSDNKALLPALTKDVPENLWLELFQKEEDDLMIFDIREQIIENALDVVYKSYMERQAITFTVRCVSKAWLQLVNWHFFRHDPGEDSTAYPPCDIPDRPESWISDEMPEPSPIDAWANAVLHVCEVPLEPTVRNFDSSSSLELESVSPVPSEYWFPGKVQLTGRAEQSGGGEHTHIETDEQPNASTVESASTMEIGSEILERVTDYTKHLVSAKGSSELTCPVSTGGGVGGGGGGDMTTVKRDRKKPKPPPPPPPKKKEKPNEQIKTRSQKTLPPLKMPSRADFYRSRSSAVSDAHSCRGLRMETTYSVASEKLESLEHLNQNRPTKK